MLEPPKAQGIALRFVNSVKSFHRWNSYWFWDSEDTQCYNSEELYTNAVCKDGDNAAYSTTHHLSVVSHTESLQQCLDHCTGLDPDTAGTPSGVQYFAYKEDNNQCRCYRPSITSCVQEDWNWFNAYRIVPCGQTGNLIYLSYGLFFQFAECSLEKM